MGVASWVALSIWRIAAFRTGKTWARQPGRADLCGILVASRGRACGSFFFSATAGWSAGAATTGEEWALSLSPTDSRDEGRNFAFFSHAGALRRHGESRPASLSRPDVSLHFERGELGRANQGAPTDAAISSLAAVASAGDFFPPIDFCLERGRCDGWRSMGGVRYRFRI